MRHAANSLIVHAIESSLRTRGRILLRCLARGKFTFADDVEILCLMILLIEDMPSRNLFDFKDFRKFVYLLRFLEVDKEKAFVKNSLRLSCSFFVEWQILVLVAAITQRSDKRAYQFDCMWDQVRVFCKCYGICDLRGQTCTCAYVYSTRIESSRSC